MYLKLITGSITARFRRFNTASLSGVDAKMAMMSEISILAFGEDSLLRNCEREDSFSPCFVWPKKRWIQPVNSLILSVVDKINDIEKSGWSPANLDKQNRRSSTFLGDSSQAYALKMVAEIITARLSDTSLGGTMAWLGEFDLGMFPYDVSDI